MAEAGEELGGVEVGGPQGMLGKVLEKVNKELPTDQIRRFASFFTDSDRIKFLLDIPLIHKATELTPDCKQKNAEESQKLRTEGNAQFAKKQFKEALKTFNESVSLAPFIQDTVTDVSEQNLSCTSLPQGYRASEELLLVLGNRSAALQYLRLYQLSIQDIDLAMEWGYPTGQAFKLHHRKAKCLAMLGKKAEAIEQYKMGIKCLGEANLDAKGLSIWMQNFDKQLTATKALSEDELRKRRAAIRPKGALPRVTGLRSDRFECTNSSFGLSMKERLGRQVIAKEEVMIGDIIGVEKPYASVLNADRYKSECYNCLTTTKSSIPCHSCSTVNFCSISCQQEAWEKYHNVECKYLHWLSDIWATKLGSLGLRITLNTPYRKLREYFGTNKVTNTKADLTSGFSEDSVYHGDYEALFHMETNNDLRLLPDIMPMCIMSILILNIIKGNPDYWKEARALGDSQQKAEAIVATSLMHHLQIIQCNASNVTAMIMSTDFRECQPLDIGLALYPTMSLLNNSCDPNIEITSYGTTCVGIAIRDIKPGDPMLMNYGMCYYTNPKEERKVHFQTQFYFDCQCEACANNWPLWDELNCKTPVILCGECGGDMPVNHPILIDCPHCGKAQQQGEILYRLKMSHDLFELAMKDTLKWQLDAALPVLEMHLRMMTNFIKKPWRDMVSCMATVKLIYNIKAYLYIIGY